MNDKIKTDRMGEYKEAKRKIKSDLVNKLLLVLVSVVSMFSSIIYIAIYF